jgi:hypothetical protein
MAILAILAIFAKSAIMYIKVNVLIFDVYFTDFISTYMVFAKNAIFAIFAILQICENHQKSHFFQSFFRVRQGLNHRFYLYND